MKSLFAVSLLFALCVSNSALAANDPVSIHCHGQIGGTNLTDDAKTFALLYTKDHLLGTLSNGANVKLAYVGDTKKLQVTVYQPNAADVDHYDTVTMGDNEINMNTGVYTTIPAGMQINISCYAE